MMKHEFSDYFSQLSSIHWQPSAEFSFSELYDQTWLMEQGSLSRQFSQHCNVFSAQLIQQSVISTDRLTDFQKQMLYSEQDLEAECVLREVVLMADDVPWLLGSTIIPLFSLNDDQFDLSRQGDTPLGLTVFQANNVKRDALHFGEGMQLDQSLVARSSRLWMNHKPMLVSELFLPDSPIYSKEAL